MDEMTRLRDDAAALIPEIIAGREQKLAEFQRRHEADKASYRFDCRRHGDFLALFITRPSTSKTTVQGKLVTAVNLGASRLITPAYGRLPDMQGTVTFQQTWSNGATVKAVYEEVAWIQMVSIETPPQQVPQHMPSQMWGHQHDPLGTIVVKDCPRAALDDSIHFVGPGVTLLMSAGLADSVFETILMEIGDTQQER